MHLPLFAVVLTLATLVALFTILKRPILPTFFFFVSFGLAAYSVTNVSNHAPTSAWAIVWALLFLYSLALVITFALRVETQPENSSKRPPMWQLNNLVDSAQSVSCRNNSGNWVPAQPLNRRINIFERAYRAWWVFTGKADCFTWPEQ